MLKRRALLTFGGLALLEAPVTRLVRDAAIRRPVVSVDRHGAKGDGVTDDTRAIAAAVAALRDGSTLRFTFGRTYLTADTVFIAEKAHIDVVMTGAVIVSTGSGDASAVMRVENCRDVRVTGGSLRHQQPGVRRHDADGLNVNHCSDVRVERVRVDRVHSIGIRVSGSRRVTVADCSVSGTMADGIGVYGGQRQPQTPDARMSAGSKALTSARCRFRVQDIGSTVTVSGAGPHGRDLVTTIVSRQSRSRVTLAKAASTSVGRQFVKIQRPSNDVVVIGNRVQDTGDDAISSVGYLTYSGPNRRLRIERNTVMASRARGILMTGTAHALVSGNTLRRIAMGGIFVVTDLGDVTSWGSCDIAIEQNLVDTVGTAYPAANYPGIGASSISNAHPVHDVRITGNTIRNAYSYYIGIGGWSATSSAKAVHDVVVRSNRCVGGNHNNPALQVVAATDVSIIDNRIERARASAITVTPEVSGRIVIRGNRVALYDRGRTGYQALDISSSAAIVDDNVVDGLRVASGTRVPQAR